MIDALRKLKLSLSAEEGSYPPDNLTEDPLEQRQASDEEQLLSDILTDLDTTLPANYQRIATRETLAGMTQLARAFQAIPGRMGPDLPRGADNFSSASRHCVN